MGDNRDKAYMKYAPDFEKHFQELDPLIQTILKGHLIIEGILENIIETICFHPEHLLKASLTFERKVAFARSFCLGKNENQVWSLILAINELRNKIAHKLDPDVHKAKVQKLRDAYYHDMDEGRGYFARRDLPDHEMAFFACSVAAGFLAEFESDLQSLRAIMDAAGPAA